MSVSATCLSEFCIEGLPSDVHFFVLLESKLKVYCDNNIKRGEVTRTLKTKPLALFSDTYVDKIVISDWEEIDGVEQVQSSDVSVNGGPKNVVSGSEDASWENETRMAIDSHANSISYLTINQTKNVDENIGLFDNMKSIHNNNNNEISSVISCLDSQIMHDKDMYSHNRIRDANHELEVLPTTGNHHSTVDNNICHRSRDDNPLTSTNNVSCPNLINHNELQQDHFTTDALNWSDNKHTCNPSSAEQIGSPSNTCDTPSTLPDLNGIWDNAAIKMKLNVKSSGSESPHRHVRSKRSKIKTISENNQTSPAPKNVETHDKDSRYSERTRKRKAALSALSYFSDLSDDDNNEIAVNNDNDDDKDYIPEVPVKIVKFRDDDRRSFENLRVDDDKNMIGGHNKIIIHKKRRKVKTSNLDSKSQFTKVKKKRGRKPKIKPENNIIREETVENMGVVKLREHITRKRLNKMKVEQNLQSTEHINDTNIGDSEVILKEEANVDTHIKVSRQKLAGERRVRNPFSRKRQYRPKDPDDRLVKINTDGLDPKLIYATKMLEKEKIKASRRTRIDLLDDHPDKYRITQVVSNAQKDRGKSYEEKSYNSYECTICGRFQCIVKEKMRVHIEQHINGDLECKKCGYILSYVKEIIRHNAEVHKADNDKLCSKMCELCGDTSNTPRAWKTHMFRVHKIPLFDCQHCDLKFSSANAVVSHTRDVHTEKNCTCEKCGQVFVSRSNWSYHVVRCTGTRTDTHVCDQCGTSLTTAIALRRHIRHNHEKERTHKCSLCPYATCTIAGLQKHINAHLGNKQHRCELCSFSCVQKYQLTSHMRTHNGDRPYKCDKCPYAVAWNVQLKAHKKVHDLPNAVHCGICGVVVKDVRSLSKHESKDHAGSVEEGGASKTKVEGRAKSSENSLSTAITAVDPCTVNTSMAPNVPNTHVAPGLSQVRMSQVPVSETMVLPVVQDGHDPMDMRTFRTYTPLEAAADYQIKTFFQYGY